MEKEFKLVEGEIVSIYENVEGERVIDARELFYKLRGENTKTKFADWIKERVKQYDFTENDEFFKIRNFTKVGNLKRPQIDYYITIDMAKELAIIENNEIGKKLRKYFIEVEKRYREIVNSSQNIFDVMRTAINQIEENEKRLKLVENISNENKQDITEIKKKIDVIIKKDYCLASDIAEELHVYSENDLPHSNFIGAIARNLGIKISYKHYYEDENIAVVPDISKGNQYYQVYYKPKAVKEIIEWFNRNKEEIEYKIIYERNTKNGTKGEIKERGYKLEKVCYKVKIK